MTYKVDDFAIDLEKIQSLIGEGLLTDWEEYFVTSLANKNVTAPLSAKQVLALSDIIEKCDSKGWFENGWRI